MNQRPFRTLFLWVIWASAILGIYLTLYSNASIWSFVDHDPSRVTWGILAMFAVGLVLSFYTVMVITLEWMRAFNAQVAARKSGLTQIDTGMPKRAVDRFFHALKMAMESTAQPDVEALLNAELAGYHRNSHAVEVMGNLLITLGLIGTVTGLTMTLSGLTGSLEALGHDQDMMLSGLRQAMAGMGTAFYNTLLGAVLGGIILRVFAQITDRGVESLYDNMMRTCQVHCSADYNKGIERDVRILRAEMAQLDALAKNLEQTFRQSGAALSDFRKEVDRLDGGEQSLLSEKIQRHRQYCDLLREEMALINEVNNTRWSWLTRVFGRRK